MAHRRLPVQRPPAQPVRYLETATPSELARQVLAELDPRQARLQQARNRELYLRWQARQAEIKVRDERFRRFWLGFGALIGLIFLVALLVVGWLLWTVFGLGALAVPAVALIACGLAAGGHRCITIVQHMH